MTVGASLEWRRLNPTGGYLQPGPPTSRGAGAHLAMTDGTMMVRFGVRHEFDERYEVGGVPVLPHGESSISCLVGVESDSSAVGFGAAHLRRSLFPVRFQGTVPSVYIRLGRRDGIRAEASFADFGSATTGSADVRLGVQVPLGRWLTVGLGAIADLRPKIANEFQVRLGGPDAAVILKLFVGYPESADYLGGSVGVEGRRPCEACEMFLGSPTTE